MRAAIAGHSPERESTEWLSKIGDALHAKLVKAGLATPRHAPAPTKPLTLREFLESYIARRTDVKPNTRISLNTSKRWMLEFFGVEKAVSDITPGDADNYLLWLKTKFSSATAGRAAKRAKQFLRAAVRSKLITENPFADVTPPVQVNEARKHFVPHDVTAKVIDACPDAEWRLLFALSRYSGLRCPSEHLALTWPDVDWTRDRFRVDSPKTGVRWVPTFPELRSYLEEAFDLAAEGSLYVINRHRGDNANLRTQLTRIIRRAGLEPWPKLFHNLRASRQTELAAEFPLHVVCTWIGNNTLIAQKHYLQVREADFQKAAKPDSAPHIAFRAKTSQNTAQQGAARSTQGATEPLALSGNSAESSMFSGVSEWPRRESNPHAR